MKTNRLVPPTLVLLLLLVFLRCAIAVEFRNGGINTVDYYHAGAAFVDVYDSPQGAPTTLNVIDPGLIAHLYIHDTSIANLTGGIISHASALDSSVVNVSNSQISHLNAYDTSRMTVNGLKSVSFVNALGSFSSVGVDAAAGSSVVDVYDSIVPNGRASGSGIFRFHSGFGYTIGAQWGGTVFVYGGTIDGSVYAYEGTVNVYGGSIAKIRPDLEADIHVYGGQIAGIEDAVDAPTRGGVVNIYGQNLHWSGIVGDPLTGELLDQSILNVPVLLKHGELRLHNVPEPGYLILVSQAVAALGLAFAWRTPRRRRGKQS